MIVIKLENGLLYNIPVSMEPTVLTMGLVELHIFIAELNKIFN